MSKPPLILVSPAIETRGAEFHDRSISLSEPYLRALIGAGAIPMVMPTMASRELVAECVRRANGIMLTGGEDIDPALYANGIPSRLRRTVAVTPDGGERDLRELRVIDEVFRQRKPLLAVAGDLPRPPAFERRVGRGAGSGHSQPGARRAQSPAHGQAQRSGA
jgi:putative glutamine amidotransferase